MTRVAIIGGGIGGLAAARALCRRGIEVSIYEAAPELREIGAGVALGPNAMKALRSLGLEDDVPRDRRALGLGGHAQRKTGRAISKTSRDQQAVPVRRGRRDGPPRRPARRARRIRFRATSSRSARAAPKSSRTAGVAVARFQDGSEVEADVIIGADGIHSVVRGLAVRPGCSAVHGQDLLPQRGPGRYRARRTASGRERAVAGASRHDRRSIRYGARN